MRLPKARRRRVLSNLLLSTLVWLGLLSFGIWLFAGVLNSTAFLWW